MKINFYLKEAKVNNQIIKYIVVGLINTLFNYSLYALLITLGFNYFMASLFATSIGIIFSYTTFGKIVFNNISQEGLYKFIFVYGIVFILQVFLIKEFISIGYSDYMAGLYAISISALISFVFNKFFVYKKITR
jgi:putative flippase GtrA